jgi:hypothetical protein
MKERQNKLKELDEVNNDFIFRKLKESWRNELLIIIYLWQKSIHNLGLYPI